MGEAALRKALNNTENGYVEEVMFEVGIERQNPPLSLPQNYPRLISAVSRFEKA